MSDEGLEARLFVLSGADLARSFPLGERAVVGRAEECEVVLVDRSISRKHALFARGEGGWFVQDLGSTNGVTRHGKRAERFELADGDEFKVGDLAVRFRLVPAVAEELEFVSAPLAAPSPKPALALRPSPPRAAPAAATTEDEIELDDAPAPVKAPPSAAPGSATREALAATHFRAARTARSSGFFAGELEQRPLWLRCLLVLGLFVVAGALAYGVFYAVRLLRAGL